MNLRQMNKKSLEMIQWTLIVFLIGLVVFLIFFYLFRTGMFHIENLMPKISGAPERFAE